MSTLIQRSFSVNIFGLQISGLYPPEQHKCLYNILSYVLFFTLVVSVPLLGTLKLLLDDNLEFKQVADSIFLIAELGCFVPKLWPLVVNGERIRKCINYFDDPFFRNDSQRVLEIEKDCVATCRRATALFCACVGFGFASWSSRPLSWEGHVFPTDIWLPFDSRNAPKAYIYCVYIYLVVAVGYGAFTSAVLDPLVGGLAYQATSQIKILKDNLEYLDEYVEECLQKAQTESKWELMHRMIKNDVDRHIAILSFVKEYENCFAQVAFSQFVGAVIVICVSCLQLTIVNPLSFDFLAMLMYLIAMSTEIYLYCHFGTALYAESITIPDAAYLGKWYSYNSKCKKLLLILMERSTRPMIVTSGKILNLSLDTFTMILRRSYSLLAVLKNYK